MAVSGISYLGSIDIRLFYLQVFVMHSLAYPFLVVQRRLECQSVLQGMLPKKYRNSFDAVKQMVKQEGFRSLYKGFTVYSLAIAIWITTVPAIAQLNMLNSPWAREDTRDIRFKGDSGISSQYLDEVDDAMDEDLRAAAISNLKRN